VVTDWGGAHDTREAALNGLDIEMGSYTNGLTSESEYTYDHYYLANPYLQMLKSGEVPMSTIDDKARRILRLIFRTSMDTSGDFGRLGNQEHYDVCRAIGDEAVVLLKNQPAVKKGAKLLPIDADKYDRILVVGDNAVRRLNEGGGSSELKAKIMISPLRALQEKYGDKVTFVQGYAAGKAMYEVEEVIPEEQVLKLRKEAVDAVKSTDLVIFVGGLNKNAYQDCESTDRREYGLPFGQPELIEQLAAKNPNLVVVLLSGNAVEMPWIDKVPAALQGWYLGSMGGYSLVDVLSGDANPSGKLPFSFPKKLADNGAHSFGEISYPGDSIREEYREDVLVGYRWHDTKKIPALFPFGHGLSYTTFSYGKPSLSSSEIEDGGSIAITVNVKNSGDRKGKEVVQLYIGDEKASVVRPLKELKGFRKVELQAGESQDVTFNITVDDLKFYDEGIAGWKAEPGKFRAYIGSSSTDIRAAVPFTLK
jgi:beta-glucosidase